MVRAWRFGLPLVIFVIVSIFLAIGLKLDPREVPSPLVGKPAPMYKLPQLLDTAAYTSASDMQGKVWLLNVWASWCVSCRAEHPLLNEIAATGMIEIVGLNYKDSPQDARAWLQQWGNPYVSVPVDASGTVGIDWGVYGVPETFVIDSEGIIRHKHIGPLDRKALQESILPLLQDLADR